MSAAALIIVFGIACSKNCTTPQLDRARLEKDVVRVLGDRGFAVQPAPDDARRPTGETASPEVIDEAAVLAAERLLVLDLESNERVLWLTHFVRGVPGAWSIGRVVCAREGEKLECPELENVLLSGMRPRRSEDVDFVAALRFHARAVGVCVRAEDDTPIDERIFGRVEIDLSVDPKGTVKVEAIAPALVAKAPLGRCLRAAMEMMNVGPFEGEAVRFRVPIDLD